MIVLDTHVLIWWITKPDKLSARAKHYLEEAAKKSEMLVSSISIWEIYLLAKRGRIQFTMDIDTWLAKVERLPFIRFIPVDNKIAVKSVNFAEQLHNDPADRMIIATSILENALLLTSDKKILNYPYVQTLW